MPTISNESGRWYVIRGPHWYQRGLYYITRRVTVGVATVWPFISWGR